MSGGYRYVYLVVDSFDREAVREGDLLLWEYKGYYYTITVLNTKTLKTRPIANIVLLKKLTDEELECINKEKNACKCIEGFEALLEKRLIAARKYFSHLNLERLSDLKKATMQAGCGDAS